MKMLAIVGRWVAALPVLLVSYLLMQGLGIVMADWALHNWLSDGGSGGGDLLSTLAYRWLLHPAAYMAIGYSSGNISIRLAGGTAPNYKRETALVIAGMMALYCLVNFTYQVFTPNDLHTKIIFACNSLAVAVGVIVNAATCSRTANIKQAFDDPVQTDRMADAQELRRAG